MRRQADDLIPPGHGVDGAVDPYIVRMGIGHRCLQLVRVKVSGEGPHTEVGARQIYGVRAALHGGGDGLRRPGGSEQFDHNFFLVNTVPEKRYFFKIRL